MPSGCRGYTALRRFRGAEYRITVENPDGVQHGVKAVLVNGQAQSSALEVRVVLG